MLNSSMRLPLLLLAALIPAAAQKVTVEFDQAAAFERYRTFAIRGGQIHSRQPSLDNDLVRQRVEAEIRRRLIEKGLSEAKPADLNVRYSRGSANRREVETYPGGWRGLGTRRVAVRYTEGTLVIDLRDAAARALVWRAIAVEEKHDPSKIQERLEPMIHKAFQKYPPKGC